jgi:deazaflavin-dependent oxidoreductase (nitroreductase family)
MNVNDRINFNQKIIEEFRGNAGVCGGAFEGRAMMLLTTKGAKSGRSLTSPLVYSTDGDHMVVIASMGGAPTNPNWYHNLMANPVVGIEVGTEQYEATATLVEGEERDTLYVAQAAQMEVFAEYAEKAKPRVIPVIRLARNR